MFKLNSLLASIVADRSRLPDGKLDDAGERPSLFSADCTFWRRQRVLLGDGFGWIIPLKV
jgi:hypothetical protein